MDQTVNESTFNESTFRNLVNTFEKSPKSAETEPYWPYPLPEAEMIASYGLRRLTQAEQRMFPGLRLVLNVRKVRLTEPPSVMPYARAGWAFGERLDTSTSSVRSRLDTPLSRAVVWTAETYPSHYLVRMPGGATLPAPYNQMAWTAISEEGGDIPITTLASVKAEAWQQKWRTAVRQNIHHYLRI